MFSIIPGFDGNGAATQEKTPALTIVLHGSVLSTMLTDSRVDT